MSLIFYVQIFILQIYGRIMFASGCKSSITYVGLVDSVSSLQNNLEACQ